jgi:hypothetical protein
MYFLLPFVQRWYYSVHIFSSTFVNNYYPALCSSLCLVLDIHGEVPPRLKLNTNGEMQWLCGCCALPIFVPSCLYCPTCLLFAEPSWSSGFVVGMCCLGIWVIAPCHLRPVNFTDRWCSDLFSKTGTYY